MPLTPLERWRAECDEWQRVKNELLEQAHGTGRVVVAADVTTELYRRMAARGEERVTHEELAASA